MASLLGNATLPGDWTESADPSQWDLKANCLLVGALHNKADWQAVSRWYWNLCKPHINATTPRMAKKVAELTEGLTDRQAKIKAVFYWATQKVRYMGITTESEAPGYEPHDVSVTFENKYGVCRDKAALLAAMLRLAGFDANMVLIHVGAKKDPDVPEPYFNHAITAVRGPDGSWQLMDCTEENAKQLLPTYLCNCSYLVSTEAGEDLAISAVVPAEDNLLRIESSGELTASGTLELNCVLHFDGINDTYFRGYLAKMKPQERRQYFERRVKAIIPGATLTGLDIKPANMRETAQPLVVRLEIAADDFLVSGARCSTMQSPFMHRDVDCRLRAWADRPGQAQVSAANRHHLRCP